MRDNPIRPGVAVVLALFHIGAVLAPFFASWNLVLLAFAVYFVIGSFGIGICYHRMLTHGGVKTYKWLEYTLATIAAAALQGTAATWVALHRMHHRHTEVPGMDPHTPRDGRWWSHLDWILYPDPKIRQEKDFEVWVPDLLRQRFYRQKYLLWLPTSLWGATCLLVGGLPALMWGLFLPITLMWHATWLVNSATHLWGSRRFETKDDSRNNWWVALLTFGEGWHNNHHHKPVSWRHGVAWYEIDLNQYIIALMRRVQVFW